MIHIPVLQKEVIKYLDPKPNENFVDCTFGFGGHAKEILEKNKPKGKVLGIELDSELYKKLKKELLKKNFSQRLILVNDSYLNLSQIIKTKKLKKISGILFDLGVSNWHFQESKKGFSFLREEPLDMRYNLRNPLTAAKIVNYWPEFEIERILREYGQEKFARKIAKEIIKVRKINPIETTFQLVETIKKATPGWYHHQRIHFATRTFQALRITVNDELSNLEKTLPQTLEILRSGGKLVVISFHSLEDRIIKNFFKKKAEENLIKILTKNPIRPAIEEIKINPRSRSAKLRAAQKI